MKPLRTTPKSPQNAQKLYLSLCNSGYDGLNRQTTWNCCQRFA